MVQEKAKAGTVDVLVAAYKTAEREAYMEAFIKEKLNPTKVATTGEAFALLNKGEVDYFVYALYSAQKYISENQISDQVDIISKYVSSEKFYMTISKKSSFVNRMSEVNTLLQKYSEDGTIGSIIQKYDLGTSSPKVN
ncbi:MAG: transporter substrate-binding domain-containing protein [Candidatus Taylorbacteria bacterium]